MREIVRRNRETREAMLRVRGAAPELLEALKECSTAYADAHGPNGNQTPTGAEAAAIDIARAAIAKAEGE